jgi:hypothetical protein
MKKLIILTWLACGFVNYGLTLGYFTHRYPESDSVGVSVGLGLLGPFALPVCLLNTPHHWRLRPLGVEERWKKFHERYPRLSRSSFEEGYN